MSLTRFIGEPASRAIDWITGVIALGTLVNILPTLASMLTAIWMALRIFDWIEARLAGRRLKD